MLKEGLLYLMPYYKSPYVEWSSGPKAGKEAANVVRQGVSVHGAGRSEGAFCPARWDSRAAVRYSKTERFCRRQVSMTVSMRSTKRLPAALWVPNDSFR